MAITKLQSEALNLADDYTFTGSISGQNNPIFFLDRSSSQTIPHNTATVLQVNNTRYDTDSGADLSNNRWTVPSGKGGLYYLESLVRIINLGTNYRRVFGYIYVNDINVFFNENFGDSGTDSGARVGGVYRLADGDHVSARVFQNGGGDRSTATGTSAFFCGFKIGD